MLKCLSSLLLPVFIFLQLSAQDRERFEKNTGEPLSIGAVVPDFRLRQVLNYKNDEIHLSEFTGKALLIDFWAAFCQPCLKQFPKLQHIQEKYGQDLQVITITHDSLQTVTDLFENIRKHGFGLLTASRGVDNNTNDSLFYAFPHKYIPHYVWIDKKRVLRAVTGYEALSEENVALLINGGAPASINEQEHNRIDTRHPASYTYQEIDIAEKMMLNDSITGLIGYSMLTGYNRKYPPSSSINHNGLYEERRIRTWNLPLGTMMRLAYGKMGKEIWEQELVPMPRVFFNIRDKAVLHKLTVNFTQAPDTTVDLYCYDLIIAEKGKRLLLERMKEDLYKYFGVRGIVTQKKVWCYILSLKDSSQLKANGGEIYRNGNMYFLRLKNAPFSQLIDHIRAYNEDSKTTSYRGLESGIIVDETSFTAAIDIDLSVRMNDIPALKMALQNYGLDLREGERLIDILLIED